MKNKSIKKWAAIAEIAGTIAVIVSLGFVIRSIDQNTKAIEAAESNNIWAAWREIGIMPAINNTDFAAVLAKVGNSESLSDVEQIQWDRYQAGAFDIWAQLFDLYKDGLISQQKWEYWDNGYWRVWQPDQYDQAWERVAGAYDPDFQQYINSRRTELGLGEQ
jgi:hypothetical protein